MHDYGVTPASLTNTGSITLQNGSRFQTDPVLESNDLFLNAAGAALSVNSGTRSTTPTRPRPSAAASPMRQASSTTA